MECNGLPLQFTQIMQRVRRLKSVDLYTELTRGEFMVLETLKRQQQLRPKAQGVYVSALADEVHVSAPAVSRMLKNLEGKGYVERNVDREDRRNTYIRLTVAGGGAQARAKAHMHRLMSRVLDRMGEDNLRVMLAQCERLIEIIEDETRKNNEGDTTCSEF